MSFPVNKHGLSRDIPAEVRRAIRQACGFGCVICGASVIEYEHVEPEFNDALVHNPEAMALLCNSCHGKVTRKFWSKQKVVEARKAPRCKQIGFSWGEFDFGINRPHIRFAGVTLRNSTIPIAVRSFPVFQIEKPEVEGGPFLLSANFFGTDSTPILSIQKNEWRAVSDVWDTEFVGGRIVIRDRASSQCLVLRAEPPNGIAIERLDMQVLHYRFKGDSKTLTAERPGWKADLTNFVIDGFDIGIQCN